jgi:hypothetical protein
MFSKAATWYIPALLPNIRLGIKIDKHNQFLLIKPEKSFIMMTQATIF